MTTADIDRIRQELVRPQKTGPKKKPNSGRSQQLSPVTQRPIFGGSQQVGPTAQQLNVQQLSPTTQRRLDDNLFLPSVPYPVQFVDVETMDHDSKYFLEHF